jgi:hypothetical protein
VIVPRILTLITMRRCTAQCDHCCFACGPKATGAIPVERMHALIEETAGLPTIERVTFTGGECFLLDHDLDALIRHATERGLDTRVVTNAYWGVDAERARLRVERLVAAGLKEMMISTGMFHARYVPVERVTAAALASACAGITTLISVEEFDGDTFDWDALAQSMHGRAPARYLTMQSFPWIPDAEGRGKAQLDHGRRIAANASVAEDPCTTILTTITVTPDQRLTACCGFPLESIPELCLGSVAEATLAELVDPHKPDPLHRWLHEAGPAAVLRAVDRADLIDPCAVRPCQPCTALHRDPQALAAAQAAAALRPVTAL